MKRYVLIPLLLFCALAAKADERSREIISSMISKVESFGSYRITFEIPLEDESLGGEFTVRGGMFYLSVYDSEVFYDGKLRYTYSKADNTVLIEDPEDDGEAFLSNPAEIFALYENDFSSEYRGRIPSGGRQLDVVELVPKGENYMSAVRIGIDPQSSLPVEISYKLPDVVDEVSLKITGIEPDIAVSDSVFLFDESRYPGVEKIDFR